MKKITTLVLSLFMTSTIFGQFSTTVLDFNNVSATATDGGTLFYNETTNTPGYEIPKGSGIHSIYESAFWFAGLDGSGTLRMSATGYFGGLDLFPGPIADPLQYGTPAYNTDYATSIWTVTKAEVDLHQAMWWQGGYVAPASILDWPGNGNTAIGVADQLAPFVDMNNNNIYEPLLGEYPYIRGDKATLLISNDMALDHTHSMGEKMGIEVHTMLYQYATADYLNDVTFVNTRVYNRGPYNYADFKCTFNSDLDVGNFSDDFVGCDTTRNMVFGYNGDVDDEAGGGSPGYGIDPPAIGVVSLNDQLDGAGYFSIGVADPSDVTSYWNYMNNSWADGSTWFVGGTGAVGSPGVTTVPTNYLFSGDPNNGAEWSEVSAANVPGDRRVFMNMSSVALPSQSDYCFEFAVVYSREAGNNNLTNITSLKANADAVQAFFDAQTDFSCDQVILGTTELIGNDFNIYPNPTTGSFTLTLDESASNFELIIRDMAGRIIQKEQNLNQKSVNVNLITSTGLYFVTIKSNGITSTKRLVIQ